MIIRNFCYRDVVTVSPDASLTEASLLMRNRHVGALVVTETKDGIARPLGLLTDRDIVVAVVAVPDAKADAIRVSDLVLAKLVTIQDDDNIFSAVQTMRHHGVRRLPVVTAEGALYGILTADDLLRVLAMELNSLAAALRQGDEREKARRRPLDMQSV
jgi:CBS domain-containing protein